MRIPTQQSDTANEISLESLLVESPKERFQHTDEDKEWHDEIPKGNEL